MSATNELRAARINGASDDGSALITKWAQMEESIRTIFGITADTDYSAAFNIATGPNCTMVGTLTLSGDPTSDSHCATKQYVQSIGSGVGIARCRVYLTGDVVESSSFYMPWDVADINEQSMWSAVNPTRITIPSGYAGDYLVGVTSTWEASGADYLDLYCKKNRSSSYSRFLHDTVPGTQGSFFFVATDLVAGDYLEFYFGISKSTTFASANTVAWAYNLE